VSTTVSRRAPTARGDVDVLVPTYNRPAALAVTLAGLAAQDVAEFRVVVSDQADEAVSSSREIQGVIRVLEVRGRTVDLRRHLPRRGMAEQRQFLLDRSSAPYALFLDDDVLLEPDVLGRMLSVIRRERCGFVGMPPIGLSYRDDVRPHEQAVEFWDGRVRPEVVRPGTPKWDRHRLHNAANALHLQERLGISAAEPRTYRVAWVGGCVLYDVAALRACGGFRFWTELPPDHCGEDVLAQLRVMARYGGCGLLPSGAYHLELPTTVPDRSVDAPLVLA
jgi:GT2 family glycosyltransferase